MYVECIYFDAHVNKCKVFLSLQPFVNCSGRTKLELMVMVLIVVSFGFLAVHEVVKWICSSEVLAQGKMCVEASCLAPGADVSVTLPLHWVGGGAHFRRGAKESSSLCTACYLSPHPAWHALLLGIQPHRSRYSQHSTAPISVHDCMPHFVISSCS